MSNKPRPQQVLQETLRSNGISADEAETLALKLFYALNLTLTRRTVFDDPYDSFSTDTEYKYETPWSGTP